MKTCLYAIAKNEQDNCEKFIAQSALFDCCVVLDTGSSDKTVEMLQQAGILVYQKQYDQFNFSQARNDAISYTPEDCEWLFSIDFNESLECTRSQIDDLINQENDGYNVKCYGYNNEDYFEYKLKFHKRNAFQWINPIHEYLVGINPVSIKPCDIKIIKKTEKVDDKKILYREICDREHKKFPENSHINWWGSRMYENYDDEKFYYYCEQYLKTSKPYTVEFRIYAFLDISKVLEKINKDQAIDYAFFALAESLVFKQIKPELLQLSIVRLSQLGITIHYTDS